MVLFVMDISSTNHRFSLQHLFQNVTYSGVLQVQLLVDMHGMIGSLWSCQQIIALLLFRDVIVFFLAGFLFISCLGPQYRCQNSAICVATCVQKVLGLSFWLAYVQRWLCVQVLLGFVDHVLVSQWKSDVMCWWMIFVCTATKLVEYELSEILCPFLESVVVSTCCMYGTINCILCTEVWMLLCFCFKCTGGMQKWHRQARKWCKQKFSKGCVFACCVVQQ